MKHVDSKNSLAELNPEDPTCFICLELDNELGEPLVSSKLLRKCGCYFVVHPQCWNAWMKDKSDYDCPICRNKSVFMGGYPTPLTEFIASSPEIPQESLKTWFIVFGIIGILTIALITTFVIFTR
jgi:hypothetical protein